jgi:plastocyanin
MKLAAAMLLVLGLAGCGSGGATTATSSSSAPAAPSVLTIKDFAFSPTPLTAKAGVAVEIRNDDDQPHTVTSDEPGVFDAGAVPAHSSPSTPLVVALPGTYAFHCSFHPFMHGQLVVQ